VLRDSRSPGTTGSPDVVAADDAAETPGTSSQPF
jgi:hypothetical protein